MTIGDDCQGRADWDRALHFALKAKATELAAMLPSDAVEKALADALALAVAEARYAEASQLAGELEARRRAKANTFDLGAERARRGGAR